MKRALLTAAVDLHAHYGPDVYPRIAYRRV